MTYFNVMDWTCTEGHQLSPDCLMKIQALRSEVEALRGDAERYRWLRGEVHGPHLPMAQVVWKLNRIRDSSKWTNLTDGPSLDAEIDAAIDAARGEKP